MQPFTRIVSDPNVMDGRPCIRGSRVTVSSILTLMASGSKITEVLAAYPTLHHTDILEALAYAAWRVDEIVVEVPPPSTI